MRESQIHAVLVRHSRTLGIPANENGPSKPEGRHEHPNVLHEQCSDAGSRFSSSVFTRERDTLWPTRDRDTRAREHPAEGVPGQIVVRFRVGTE